jgi:hypothetical protein
MDNMAALGIFFLLAIVAALGYALWLRRRQITAADAGLRDLMRTHKQATDALMAAGEALASLNATLRADLDRLAELPITERLSLEKEQQRSQQLLKVWRATTSPTRSRLQRGVPNLPETLPAMQEILRARGGAATSIFLFDTSALSLGLPDAERIYYGACPTTIPLLKRVQESCLQEWVALAGSFGVKKAKSAAGSPFCSTTR